MREAFGQLFDPRPGYLNTASIGIPPAAAVDAVLRAIQGWRDGAQRAADFDEPVAVVRRGFAALAGVPESTVALGATVSQVAGLVAASIPDGATVLVPEKEFTSVSFPFAAQHGRGVTATEVAFADLPKHAAGYDVVAASVVQSSSGAVCDLDALRTAVAGTGTRVLLDATQALGWLPLRLDWADWVVAACYKWVMAPRGLAWLAVRGDPYELVPHSASWYGGADLWDSIYGLPMRLAEGTRRLDLSPSWFSHIGAAEVLPWLSSLDMAEVRAHDVGLANRLREGLAMPEGDSAMVSVALPGAQQALAAAGVTAAARAGSARLAFHLYNTEHDVDLALRALRPLVT